MFPLCPFREWFDDSTAATTNNAAIRFENAQNRMSKTRAVDQKFSKRHAMEEKKQIYYLFASCCRRCRRRWCSTRTATAAICMMMRCAMTGFDIANGWVRFDAFGLTMSCAARAALYEWIETTAMDDDLCTFHMSIKCILYTSICSNQIGLWAKAAIVCRQRHWDTLQNICMKRDDQFVDDANRIRSDTNRWW